MEGFVGRLKKAMCGTRSAPLMWQKMVRQVMAKLGSKDCITVPCMFYHQERDMYVFVHVDDFLCFGEVKDLKWFQESLEKEFELKAEIIQPGGSAAYLGRTISWEHDGIGFEGQ